MLTKYLLTLRFSLISPDPVLVFVSLVQIMFDSNGDFLIPIHRWYYLGLLAVAAQELLLSVRRAATSIKQNKTSLPGGSSSAPFLVPSHQQAHTDRTVARCVKCGHCGQPTALPSHQTRTSGILLQLAGKSLVVKRLSKSITWFSIMCICHGCSVADLPPGQQKDQVSFFGNKVTYYFAPPVGEMGFPVSPVPLCRLRCEQNSAKTNDIYRLRTLKIARNLSSEFCLQVMRSLYRKSTSVKTFHRRGQCVK